MSLTALFMSICIHTTLPCDQVEVKYSVLAGVTPVSHSVPTGIIRTLGRASVYSSGRQVIEIHEVLEHWSEWQRRDVMMHEITHLVVWQANPTTHVPAHGRQFRRACYKIAEAISVPKKRCKGGH